MTPDLRAELIAVLVGAAITVLWRIIDRFLPDDDDAHPLPPHPSSDDD